MKFIRAQISALIASGTDFSVTFILASILGCWYLLASIVGTVSGGLLSFSLNRRWVFKQTEQERKRQFMRFVLIWSASLLLNTAGVYLLTEVFGIYYIVSKLITAVMVGVFFNYYFQNVFVFSNNE